MEVAVRQKVTERDNFGRFISEIERAAYATMLDAANEGVALSRTLAPKGHKDDPRTRTLEESFYTEVGRTRAAWGNTARHAVAQETGARRHPITGRVHFFWEREGRDWVPGSNQIDHPGNPPRPFLRPAYRAIMARILEIARRHYPQ